MYVLYLLVFCLKGRGQEGGLAPSLLFPLYSLTLYFTLMRIGIALTLALFTLVLFIGCFIMGFYPPIAAVFSRRKKS